MTGDDTFFDYFAIIVVVAGLGGLITPALALRRLIRRRRVKA